MQTSWPKGDALPRSRKRRKRPQSRVVREERRTALATSQVVRKLVHGRQFDPTVPRSTDAAEVRNLECCHGCGGPLRGAFPGDPIDGTCARCLDTAAPRANHSPVQIVGVHRGALLGTHRTLLAPGQGDPDVDAGDALRRMIDGRAARAIDAAIAKKRGAEYRF